MVRARAEVKMARRLDRRPDEAPIGVFLDPESDEITYFASEADADAAIPESAIDDARASFGAWTDLDLDWDEVEVELDRIRHGRPRAAAEAG